jgi:hypothetical protein
MGYTQGIVGRFRDITGHFQMLPAGRSPFSVYNTRNDDTVVLLINGSEQRCLLPNTGYSSMGTLLGIMIRDQSGCGSMGG